jgi:hypothetical protein
MKILIFIFPLALFSLFIFIKLISPDYYSVLIQEDSIIENMQFICYGISSIFSCIITIRFITNRMPLHGILYAILTIGLLLASMEEISWGQRLLHVANPDYFVRHNVQGEISLHNLDMVQPRLHKAYILVGAYGAFAWIPVCIFMKKARTSLSHIVNYIVPEWFISPFFFFTFFIYTIFEYVAMPQDGGFLAWRDQEPMELLLSMGFLALVATGHIRLRRHLADASGR